MKQQVIYAVGPNSKAQRVCFEADTARYKGEEKSVLNKVGEAEEVEKKKIGAAPQRVPMAHSVREAVES